ncbi:hypothetical protein [Burkholderia sp. lyk4-R2A-23]|nr:hypothetical protein [Burkholderia sp. lyk4-R2A-23]
MQVKLPDAHDGKRAPPQVPGTRHQAINVEPTNEARAAVRVLRGNRNG